MEMNEQVDTSVVGAKEDWDVRFRGMIAAYQDRKAEERATRAYYQHRRESGLKLRHALKERRGI